MSLADLVIETKQISDANNQVLFSVRGLCFNDLTVLIREFGEDLDSLFEFAQKKDVKDSELIEVLLSELPEVVSKAIALAADEPDFAHIVTRLPLKVQADSIREVWRMTVDASGGLKKLVGSLMSLMTTMKTDFNQLKNTGTSD